MKSTATYLTFASAMLATSMAIELNANSSDSAWAGQMNKLPNHAAENLETAFGYIANSIAHIRRHGGDGEEELDGEMWSFGDLADDHMGEVRRVLDGRSVPEQVGDDIWEIA